MKRVVLLLMVLLSVSLVAAQEGDARRQAQEQRIPTTLAEAHEELERILSAEELGKIDAMPSEDDMALYHFSLGLNIRNGWGLWRGGPLAKHIAKLGFTHADDISEVILETFWCKRHGQDFRLEERAAFYKKSMEAALKADAEEEQRVAVAKAAIRDRMMGLRFKPHDVPVVRMPIKNGVSARFLCPFRNGVFFSRCLPGNKPGLYYMAGYHDDPPHGELRTMETGDDFYTVGHFLDPADQKIHWILLPELDRTYAAVVADERAWFAGLKNGETVLVSIGDQDRMVVPLPKTDEFPDLGLDGQALLAVYSKTIYRLTDQEWTLVHSGNILPPRSALPQRYGNTVFFRDEGGGDAGSRHLWWLTMGEGAHLSLLERDAGVLRGGGPQWHNVHSYCVTGRGDLWACVGSGHRMNCLFRRSTDGRYSVAVLNGSVLAAEDPLRSDQAERYIHVSGVTALPDDTLLLVGVTGLYRLKGNELVQELAFAPPDGADDPTTYNPWEPNGVLALDDRSYLVSSSGWDGVYWLRQGDDGQWSAQAIEEGDRVVW